MTTTAPSGTQLRISHADHRATVTEVGASLREYAVGDRDVITPFGEDELQPACSGAVLVPWPNRIRDGRYRYREADYRLPLNEPERSTAIHGLVGWQRWSVVAHTDDAVTLEHRLVPVPGYPFALRVSITYALSDAGLETTLVVANEGSVTAPLGVGFHPWLSPGGAALDDCTLHLDARTHVTSDERLLPTGTEPVAGDHDFRTPRSLAGIALDDAWVDVVRDADGLSWARLAAPDGRTAAVWMDGSLDAWQVCTGDALDEVEMRRTGLAAEPMSCVADAFNSGERVVDLGPGAVRGFRWGATLL
ncbi:aldose 1-epimerase family protein [Cellulomonas fimi]|uniref:Aldose 1-epimerase family protein n=1 Tax=Cellulomonas fimi TaxID=1708 RepID=A0A7Y0LZJ8_CELFI|nr:aldose 1-epimerase family protein [Cellulomonas fimi]NMR20829.1 aldose 1-epimerase family protein [Cellulomonas fimi]